MTDIVQRLRKASVYEYGEATYSPLGDEAADEIERLRVGLEYIRTLADDIDAAARVAMRGQEKPC
jgi:hypothetical protein